MRFIAVNDGVDSLVEGSNDFNPIRNWANELHARESSKKVRAVKRMQAQRGERPLAALLGEQEAALARRRAELDWAGQVCRAMREDGVEFATLDAHRYLSRLDRPADQPGFFDLRADAAPTVSHLRTTGESGC